MGQFAALRTQKIEGFEELKEVVLGTRREIVQLERGKIKGEIAHAVIGDLPIDTASFNLGIRTKGGSHRDRIGIGLLAASSNHVVRSSYESRPGDVMVLQPGCEHENRYYGGASMIIVMASEGDIESSYGTEARMCDPTCWRNHYKGDGEMVTSVIPRLQSLLGRLRDLSLTAEATEFWKRAVIEAVTANVVAGMPSERDGPLPSALKIVRQVEEYLDARPSEPIHISEILQPPPRAATYAASRVSRGARDRPDRFPSPPPAVCHPHRAARARGHPDDRGNRDAVRIPESRPVCRLLPSIVWRVPVRNAAAAPATAWSATTANQRMSAATSGTRHQLRSRMLRACHGLAMLGLDAEGRKQKTAGK